MASESQEKKMYLEGMIGKESAIFSMSVTEGGVAILSALLKDILAIMETLSERHKELTLQEFVALSARIYSNLELAKVIAGSKASELRLRQELADLIAKTQQEEGVLQ